MRRPPHLERGELVDQGVTDRLDLRRDDRQHRGIDTVKLIETAPRAALRQAREDLPDSLGNHQDAQGLFLPEMGGWRGG